MSLLQALVLGLVQGLTEFLPVSSSGHLVLVPFLFGWKEPTLAFDVAVHIGTLAAVAYVYRARLAALARTATTWKSASEQDRSLLTFVVIATIPAAVIGAVFNSAIEEVFLSPVRVSFLLGLTGYFLMSSETIADHHQEPPRDAVDRGDAITLGIAQAVSILPGISRSGSTIGAGLRRGLSREAAARFSFLMSIPIIAGATIVKIPDMLSEGASGNGMAFVVGVLASAISGFAAIKWFLGLLGRRSLRPFGVYCFLMMVVGLVTALARG